MLTSLFRAVSRKSAALLHSRLQQLLPQHEEADGAHEAAPQAQHLLPVSSLLVTFGLETLVASADVLLLAARAAAPS